MPLTLSTMVTTMITAARGSLNNSWPQISALATTSIQTLAQNIIDVELMTVAGTITNNQAILKVNIQKDAFKILLLTEEGLGLLAVEAAINAVIDSIKTLVNTTIGIALL